MVCDALSALKHMVRSCWGTESTVTAQALAPAADNQCMLPGKVVQVASLTVLKLHALVVQRHTSCVWEKLMCDKQQVEVPPRNTVVSAIKA